MPRRKTREEFAAELKAINPNIAIVGDYVNSKTPLSVKCLVCGREWSVAPASLLNGSRCRECFNRSRVTSEEDYVQSLHKKHPNIDIVGGYKKASAPALFRCNDCGHQWRNTPSHVLYGRGCPNCSLKKRAESRKKSHEQFVSDVAKIHPDFEILSKYEGGERPIDVRCNKCGRTWTAGRASQLLTNRDCLGCRQVERRKTNQQFIDELSAVNRFITPLDKYAGCTTKIRFKCGKCGEIWEAIPNSVLHGTGCPHCSKGCGSFFEHALLYAIRASLGHDAVVSRDKTAIGKELDVYIPSMGIAFEPGAWFYHEGRVDSDYEKLALCESAEIKLSILYYGVPDGVDTPSWCLSERSQLGPTEWDKAVSVIKKLLSENDICDEHIDWDAVYHASISTSGKKTTQRFIEELSRVNANIDVLGSYESETEHIEVKCKVCGHEWTATPHNLLSGRGCPECKKKKISTRRRLSENEFLNKMRERNPRVRVLGKYTGSDNKVLVECIYCGKRWESKAGNLLQGKACASCSRKKPNDYFLNRVALIHPNIEVLSTYDGIESPVDVVCNKCGHTWTTTPKQLYSGDGCQKCAWIENGKKLRMSVDEFRERLSALNPTIRLVGPYVKMSEKTDFHCDACGDTWSATPSNILSGRGCPTCGRKKSSHSRSLNADKFSKRMQEIYPELELVTDYVDRSTKVTVKCTKCGRSRTLSPGYLLSKKAKCPHCKNA